MGDALDSESAKNRVISIGIATDKQKIIVLGVDKLTPEQQANIYNSTNKHFEKYGEEWSFRYQYFESEYDMLYTFFKDLLPKMSMVTDGTGLDMTGPIC